MNVNGAWSEAEATAFLESSTAPVRLACHTDGGRLWMLSLWYRYRDGRLECATSASADVVEYLRRDDAVAFEVSTNDPPYKGVRGNGTADIEPDPEKELLRALLERYLGGTDNDLADMLLDEGRKEVQILIDPAKVYTWDFTNRMRDVE